MLWFVCSSVCPRQNQCVHICVMYARTMHVFLILQCTVFFLLAVWFEWEQIRRYESVSQASVGSNCFSGCASHRHHLWAQVENSAQIGHFSVTATSGLHRESLRSGPYCPESRCLLRSKEGEFNGPPCRPALGRASCLRQRAASGWPFAFGLQNPQCLYASLVGSDEVQVTTVVMSARCALLAWHSTTGALLPRGKRMFN